MKKRKVDISEKEQRQFDALTRDLLKLKGRADRDDAELMLKLRDVSEQHAELIALVCGKFTKYLSSYGLCEVRRFTAFLTGLGYIDDATAIKIGVPMVIALATTQNRANVKEAVRLAVESANERGVRPNARVASGFMVLSGARDEGVRGVSKAAKLQAEVNRLLAENQKLKADSLKLRHELRKKDRLIEQLQKAGPRKRATTLASASAV